MMIIAKGFFDLCIPYNQDHKKLISIIEEALILGYKTIAIEQVFDHTKKDVERSSDIFPIPIDLNFLQEFKEKMKILRRLTIIYSDISVSHAMGISLNIRKYDLIAGTPKNENALNHCFMNFIGDIISYDADVPKLLVQRKQYQVAVNRGIFIEIKYCPAIQNSVYRKDLIKLAHNYHTKGKSRNIIFTSGAKSVFDLRCPYDISNLAIIFGLTEEQGKNSISSTCRKLFLKSESRRFGKTNMIAKGKYIGDKRSDIVEDTKVLFDQPHKKLKLCEF